MKQRPCAIIFIFSILGSLFGFYFNLLEPLSMLGIFISAALLILIKNKNFRIVLFLSLCFFITSLSAKIYQRDYIEKISSITDEVKTYQGVIRNIKTKNDASKIAMLKVTKPSTLNILLVLKDEASQLKINNGDVIAVKGMVKKFLPALSAVHFDGTKYALSKNIHGKITIDNESFLLKSNENLASFTDNVRESLTAKILKNLTPHEASLLLALMIGDTALFDDYQKEIFNMIGAQHILAVSGLQVSLIAFILYLFFTMLFATLLPLKYFHRSKPISAIICLLFIWLFIAVCGYPNSAVRAGLMSSIILFSVFFIRKVDVFDAFYLSGTLTLFFDPSSILDLGFLLSYAAVFGLLLSHHYSAKFIFALKEASLFLSYFMQLILSATAAYLATLPIIAVCIGKTSVLSILSNLILMPFASICQCAAILFGFLGALINSFSLIKAASFFANVIEIIADFLSDYFSLTTFLPYGSDFLVFVSCCTLFIAFILLLASNYKSSFLSAIFCLLFLTGIYWPSSIKLIISSIPVGQGDATLIQMPNQKNILIDAGGQLLQGYDPGENIVVPLLRRKGISELDILLITHPDPDHILGSFAVIDKVKVKEIWISSKKIPNESLTKLLEIALEKKIPVKTIKDILGDHFFDDAQLSVLAPNTFSEEEYYEELKTNDNSLVVKISFAGKTALFPADIEYFGEKLLLSDKYDLKADILKAPHHGSKTSSSEEFISAVAPKIVIFSTGKNNKFGFPHKEVIERYEKIGAKTYNTAEDGEIILEIDKEHFNIYTFKSSYQKKLLNVCNI